MAHALRALLLVMIVLGPGAVSAPADATTPPPEAARAATDLHPRHGGYLGRDARHHEVTFGYDREGVHQLTIGPHRFGHLELGPEGHGWHHVCHGGWCTSGFWIGPGRMHGVWSEASMEHPVSFHAHLVD